MLRSSTSSALNFGESRGAESNKDFIHKRKITLKELRETQVSPKTIKRANVCCVKVDLEIALDECNHLISIFVASMRTAEKILHTKKNQI